MTSPFSHTEKPIVKCLWLFFSTILVLPKLLDVFYFCLLHNTKISVLKCQIIQLKQVFFRGKRKVPVSYWQIQCVWACMWFWHEIPIGSLYVRSLCFYWVLISLRKTIFIIIIHVYLNFRLDLKVGSPISQNVT